MLGCMGKTCCCNFFISVLYHELKSVMIVVTERRRWKEGREEMLQGRQVKAIVKKRGLIRALLMWWGGLHAQITWRTMLAGMQFSGRVIYVRQFEGPGER
jgi:hypothetical protein